MLGGSASTVWRYGEGITDDAIEQEVRELQAAARELGLTVDEATAREKAAALVAQAEEHDVPVEQIRNRNLLRELFSGGARPPGPG